MLKFQGKVALVTGSGTGIGKAIAAKFVENGASVIILGRRREPLEGAVRELEGLIPQGSGATVTMFSGIDVADEQAVNGMFEKIRGNGTVIDYLINNAGVSGPVTCFTNAPLDEFKGTVAIHLSGTFWCSVKALKVMKKGSKIITISTFFTEERPLEQRPYRFRSPYTASQGAKNRLAEAMSWELAQKGIISIATNPGPVHSDRIYKTVYPKAAAEFMRVGGFEGMTPVQVEQANAGLLPLLGEDQQVIGDGIAVVAEKTKTPAGTLAGLLEKIQGIAEKVQKNTSHMIANKEFLSQSQVAESVLNLCDDQIAAILDGKVVPGDRVFYPVRAHVGTTTPGAQRPDLKGSTVILAVSAGSDANRVMHLAEHIEGCGGNIVCLVSDAAKGIQDKIGKLHSHLVDLSDPGEVKRWLDTASTKFGRISSVVYFTGDLQECRLTELDRAQWEELVARFITTPAGIIQQALEHMVPGGGKDPRLYKDAGGTAIIIGPELPAGRITGVQRAQIEVFRGALRPLTTTINQEFSDVLKTGIRVFTILPGSVTGAGPENGRIADAFDFMSSDDARSSSEVTFCVDESR